jgi:ribosomal protein S18 acetylase RimI-like enzyme
MNRFDSSYRFEYRDYAEALYQALTEDAFYVTMEQSVDDRAAAREALLRYLDYSIREAREYGELYIPVEHRYGISIWQKPLPCDRELRMKTEKQQFLVRHMGEASAAAYNEIVGFMSAQSDSIVDPGSWYLSIVGILPGFQNRGLGVELVQGILEQSDRAGVPTYLETFTPRNEAFYERLGYRSAARFFEPTTRASYSLMTRGCNGA